MDVTISGIRVVGVGFALKQVNPDGKLSYDEENVLFREWCKNNKASYYAQPHEDFFRHQAIEQAIAEGNTLVVVEDLS